MSHIFKLIFNTVLISLSKYVCLKHEECCDTMCSVGNLQVEPSWRNKDQFIRDHLQDVFMLDALESSHPISVPVEHTDQIREIFDGVSYSKSMFLWIVSVKKRTVEERCCSITLIWHIFMLLSLGES